MTGQPEASDLVTDPAPFGSLVSPGPASQRSP
ncbi:uncharacterized protein METZ01_LOCUS21317 [marine metagenome]|uniref:Uncharacterized protein n=1 Tax=marine metagenome TaxID=408172 RepID=A0A381PSL7_9ZZZZ